MKRPAGRAAAELALRAALLVLIAFLGSCGPTPAPRYWLGEPYRASGVWYYPREAYDLTETGLATIIRRGYAPLGQAALTTNGEAFDPDALMAAHPVLQLPAIARLTNLETGLSLVLRINDRGKGDPRYLVEVTPRVAKLLGMNEVTRVRLTVLPVESREAVDGLPGAPRIAVDTAPRTAVSAVALDGPGDLPRAGGGLGGNLANPATGGPGSAVPIRSGSIGRLPETVGQGMPRPGRLWVRLDSFPEYEYAARQRAKMTGYPSAITTVFEGRLRLYRVDVGPFEDTAAAGAALGRAFSADMPDARIVVD